MRATLIRTHSHTGLREADRTESYNHGVPEVPGAAELEVRVHKFPITTSLAIFPTANISLLT